MKKPIYSSAADVEAAFYDALSRSDFDAMMSVWAEDEEVVCIHPDTPRQVGLPAVRESWRQLFTSGVRLVVQTSHSVVHASVLLTVHSVVEHIAVEGDDRLHPPINATNVYVRGPLGWRMVLHQASTSPEPIPPAGHSSSHVIH
ncbi:MAG: nuclear transport factor 2 family protein [Rhodocyclaceae bacterium]|nr:nuclear transport factor 2 family protein [Rhodocyclaceae bacterium]MCL4757235.1 nuclear transport factor 2 family protein [Rhodocyclaceae bacterium]